ncbi:MAG TPA: DNA polymerase IV [Patescibacteria group bacterium]|nr:DNA polymerase IV [Patescibacteria group bacterium]
MPAAPAGRVILHLDMDAFYAAIEVLDDPGLAGKPIIVGHRGRRGVVSTCSYEARRYGVHSAMPSVTAERLCPQATWLPVRMDRYVEVSRRLRLVFEEATPIVEPLSIDEAFLDLTGVAREGRPVATLEDGRRVARWLKDRIREREGLSASVGVAPNKYLAKVASDLEKPDGLVVLPLEAIPSRLWPLPVTRLWGVGPKTAARLVAAGLRTIGDVARQPLGRLVELAGESWGGHLRELAHGRDDRPVDVSRAAKSISEERTYAEDLVDPDQIDRALLARAEGVARELRREKLVARTVHLKVRTGDFTTWTRARTLPAPTDLTEAIVGAARDLLRERIRLGRRGVRLLGVGVDGLLPAAARGGAAFTAAQGGLFSDPADERARRSARVADAVRERMGEESITRARLLRPGASGSARVRTRSPTPAKPTR